MLSNMIVAVKKKEGLLAGGMMALFGLALLLFGLHNIISFDVWWQIKTGEWILNNGFVANDPFNYLTAELPWIEMRWLYSVLVFLVFKGVGLNGLIGLKLLFLGLTFFLLGRFYRGPKRWVVLLGLTVTLAAAHNRFFIRPELVSYLLVVVWLFCLYRYKAGGTIRWLLPLPFLQIIWTNSHTLFILGPVLLWLFTVVEALGPKLLAGILPPDPQPLSMGRLRPLFIVAALSTLACLINPYFLEGALFPLQLFSEINSGHALKTLIAEFLGPFAYAGFRLPHIAYLVMMGVAVLGLVLNYKRFQPSTAVILAAFIYLSFLAVRNVALLAFVAGFFIIYHYSQWAEREDVPERLKGYLAGAVWAAGLVFLLVMIPLVVSNAYYRNNDKAFGFGVALDRFPIEAMAFIRANDLPEPVLNNLGDGGYLIFEGGEKSVYSDGRLEVYGGERVEAAIRLFQSGAGFEEVVADYDIRTVLLRHYSDQGLMRLLEEDPDWQPVYYDGRYLVYLRGDGADGLALDWQSPGPISSQPAPDWLPPALLSGLFPAVSSNSEQILLGELFLNVGNLELALAYFDEAIERGSVNDTVRFYRGVIYRARGQERLAADIFKELDDSFLKQAGVHIFAATIYEGAGNNRAALAAYQQALALGARSENSYRAVVRLALAESDYMAAVSAQVELAQLLPGNGAVWHELGLIYLELGETQRARQAFEQALAVDPGYEAAADSLEGMGNNE